MPELINEVFQNVLEQP